MTKKEAEAEEKRKTAVLAKAGELAMGIKRVDATPRAPEGEFKSEITAG